MTTRALSGIVPEWYELPSDPDTKFHLRPLTTPQRLEVLYALESDHPGNAMLLAAKYGMLDWSGIVDQVGVPVPFRADQIETLPLDVFVAVAQRIMEISRNSEDERKN